MTISQLHSIGSVILNARASEYQLSNALQDFADRCSQLTKVTIDTCFDANANDAYLSTGLAIAPSAAAHCVLDYQRSIQFIRATYAALCDLSHTQQRVRVVYAGCGPFATLILPLLPHLNAQQRNQIDFELIDIHASNLTAVSQLVAHWQLDHQLNITYTCCDASRYQLAEPAHLIISETMQKALEQEPQVAIMANLAPQLHPNGLFIPNRILVDLWLINLQSEQQEWQSFGEIDVARRIQSGQRQHISSLMQIERDTLTAYQPTKLNPQQQVVLSQFKLPVSSPSVNELNNSSSNIHDSNNNQLSNGQSNHNLTNHTLTACLLTHLDLYKHYQLTDYQSDLTLPRVETDLFALQGKTLQAVYQMGNYPKIEFKEV